MILSRKNMNWMIIWPLIKARVSIRVGNCIEKFNRLAKIR